MAMTSVSVNESDQPTEVPVITPGITVNESDQPTEVPVITPGITNTSEAFRDADAVVQLKRKGKVYLTDVKDERVYIADIGNYSFTALNENDPVRAADIAFDETNQKLFWINSRDNIIYRGSWDMAESIPVSIGHLYERASISLNERQKQIFCVFHGGSKISRIDHDNPNTWDKYVLHDLTDPSNIIVAEDIGYLYFTQNRRAIYRWKYNSHNDDYELLKNIETGDIDAMAVDIGAEKIIVSDYTRARVIVMNLNGNKLFSLSDYNIADIVSYEGDFFLIGQGISKEDVMLKFDDDEDSFSSVKIPEGINRKSRIEIAKVEAS